MTTDRKRSAFLVATNSIQLNAKAMIFEAPTATRINLIVSMLPHNLSKYFKEAGTNIKEAISYNPSEHSETGYRVTHS